MVTRWGRDEGKCVTWQKTGLNRILIGGANSTAKKTAVSKKTEPGLPQGTVPCGQRSHCERPENAVTCVWGHRDPNYFDLMALERHMNTLIQKRGSRKNSGDAWDPSKQNVLRGNSRSDWRRGRNKEWHEQGKVAFRTQF